MQLILTDIAHESVRSMMSAKLLCDLSVVACTIQEQVRPWSMHMCSPSLCQAIQQSAHDMHHVLQSTDENQATSWCKRSIRAAQLGISMFAQLRKFPEADFLDPLPARAPSKSTYPGTLLFLDIACRHLSYTLAWCFEGLSTIAFCCYAFVVIKRSGMSTEVGRPSIKPNSLLNLWDKVLLYSAVAVFYIDIRLKPCNFFWCRCPRLDVFALIYIKYRSDLCPSMCSALCSWDKLFVSTRSACGVLFQRALLLYKR